MGDDVFSDIEHDNNPSFYGDHLMLASPYSAARGRGAPANKPDDPGAPSLPPAHDLVNSTLGLLNKIADMLNQPEVEITVVATENLVSTLVVMYLIRVAVGTDEIIVKRRYLEFKLYRDTLLRLFPLVIIPPIPEKHSLLSYVVNSLNNQGETELVEMRKRFFTRFLRDVVGHADSRLRQSPLTHKFLDPSYEMAWENALHEPPVLTLPTLLLLTNPVDTRDQNGLYVLLPMINGFDMARTHDNLLLLKKIDDDLRKLHDQKLLIDAKRHEFELKHSPLEPPSPKDAKSSPQETSLEQALVGSGDAETDFDHIPAALIKFESEFHATIKALTAIDKLNIRLVKNFKHMVHNLIELGGNLNNFSLQAYDLARGANNQLLAAIERFGLTIDLNFLTYEGFVQDHLIPEWEEPIHQMIQYVYAALVSIKFYKYKVIQYKLLYKLKFNKYQEVFGAVTMPALGGGNADLDHLEGLPSASLNQAIQKIKHAKQRGPIAHKKSWYGLFGGGSLYKQYTKKLADDNGAEPSDLPLKLGQYERELTKLNQLIALTNRDMHALTAELMGNYRQFVANLERKWLKLMIAYLRAGKLMFEENRDNFVELEKFLKGQDAVA